MTNFRRERGDSFLREELTIVLRNEMQDPRVAAVTITEVELTKDRRIARVYVACYSGEQDLQEGIRALQNAQGFLRSRLSRVLRWPWTPTLEFRPDRSWEYGEKMDKLFDQIAIEPEEPSDE